MKKILGIDPGTATTGFGVVSTKRLKLLKPEEKLKKKNGLIHVSHGIITTPVGMAMGERLLLLRKKLKDVIKENEPEAVVIEQIFFGRNSKTAMMVGQARGVVMMTAAEANLPTFEFR